MGALAIDINCDLGEWNELTEGKRDVYLMKKISSCNIACTGHIGNKLSLSTTIKRARTHKVMIGAHPSFPDRENFGRKHIDLFPKDFQDSISEQLEIFKNHCKLHNAMIHHVKPHGALYHFLAINKEYSNLFLSIVEEILGQVIVYTSPGSMLASVGKQNGFTIWIEGFADRTYQDNGSLTYRSDPKAIIHEPEEAWHQVNNIIKQGRVYSLNGKSIPMPAQTICIHGDHPNSMKIADYIYENLAR